MKASKKAGFRGSKLTKPSCLHMQPYDVRCRERFAGPTAAALHLLIWGPATTAKRENHIQCKIAEQSVQRSPSCVPPGLLKCNQSGDCTYLAGPLSLSGMLVDDDDSGQCTKCMQPDRYDYMDASWLWCACAYLLRRRMAEAKSPAATWSAARAHFCSHL